MQPFNSIFFLFNKNFKFCHFIEYTTYEFYRERKFIFCNNVLFGKISSLLWKFSKNKIIMLQNFKFMQQRK